MQIEDFVRVYQAKSDEELIQLAAAPEQLTSEARLALRGELSRRRITVAEDSGESQNNWEEQISGKAFLHIRERLSPFLRVSLLLLVLVVVTEGLSILLGTGVFWIFHRLQVHRSGFLVWAVSYVLTGLALLVASRFFLAVPAVILDDFSVGRAMLRSDELTQGKWLALAALLAKFLIGGYVAGMCPFWLVSFVRVSVPLPSWFPWILTIAPIIGVTVVEPTMFIGFALLYLKTLPPDSAPSRVLASQLA
jgi:hypothetical protein